MNIRLPTQIRIESTWQAGHPRSEGFLDLVNDVPLGTAETNLSSFSNYRGYATSIELNSHFNYWAVVALIMPGESRSRTHLVLMPNRNWFDEWLSGIEEKLSAIVLVAGEDKTGVA